MIRDPDEPSCGLYVHVPFCAQKCHYCAFYSQPASGATINRYIDALIREMAFVEMAAPPRTVFFGGGTPSLLTCRQWEKVLEAMHQFHLLGAPEWTVECNPATVSLDKAKLLRRYGVNRISMGVQSFDDALLDRLGRVHSRSMVFKSFETLRSAGFDNINIDLMFAIPGQTLETWRETLREAVALNSEHLSCYEVIYEEDTALYAQLQAGEFSVDEDLACAMYETLIEVANQAGFKQYEIANFARHKSETVDEIPARACQHNINYWRGSSYYGLGPSATGCLDGVRTKNWANTTIYCDKLENGQPAVEWREQLAPLARAGETAAFGLRMNAGWPFQLFQKISGFDLREEWASEMSELVSRGLADRDPTRFRLTDLGLRFADSAAELFLRPKEADHICTKQNAA